MAMLHQTVINLHERIGSQRRIFELLEGFSTGARISTAGQEKIFYFPVIHYKLFFWSATLICSANAEGWDDFSNNLATDLSPLIALFGENATKQFLSESLSPLDNFIFAMAPLGILTALVSAIRVCGSPSLRAFIGRAQEGEGVVEAELCSSTSRSVSELYNNGGIARVFGRPKILEVVRDPNSTDFYDGAGGKRAKAGIYTLKEYIENGKEESEWKEGNKGVEGLLGRLMGKRRASKNSKNEKLPTDNPNLSLNIGIKQQSGWVFWLAALTGFVLQSAVLVFGAIVTYYLQWRMDGRSPERWAFPLGFSGTLLQCTGMFLCARLVEQSTKERKFHRKSESLSSDQPSRLYWLQPGNQAVGDQIFDAFAHNDDKNPLRQYVFSFREKGPKASFLVWVAIIVTMGGFVLQFVGLRAMHSSVAVFQLGAMLVMSIIRASLRTRRFDTSENHLGDILDLVQGHELDWQALEIETPERSDQNSAQCWLVCNSPVNPQHDTKSKPTCEPRTKIVYGEFPDQSEVQTTPEVQRSTRESLGAKPATKPCLADRLLKYRSRLAWLTTAGSEINDLSAWEDKHVSVRHCARRLQMILEGTADILFSDIKLPEKEKDENSFLRWDLEVATPKCGESQQTTSDSVSICIRKDTEANGWKVDLSDSEACLGLWAFSLKQRYLNSRKASNFRRVVAVATKDGSVPTDLEIWIGGMKTKPQKSEFKRDDDTMPLFGQKSVHAGTECVLTVPANSSLVVCCAQDILMNFVAAASHLIDGLGGQTNTTVGPNGFRLVNDRLSRLVQIYDENGLGSKEDAYLCIVPVLLSLSQLPSVSNFLDTARLAASDVRKRGDWKQAEGLLQWAWRSSKSEQDLQKSAVAFSEFYRWMKVDDKQEEQFDYSAWILELGKYDCTLAIATRYEKVFEAIKSSDLSQSPDILDALEEDQLIDALVSLRPGVNTHKMGYSKRTALHWAAIRGWLEVVVGLLELGAFPDSLEEDRRTPLSYACEGGDLDIVRALLQAGKLPNNIDKYSRTAVSYAAANGHESIVQVFAQDSRVVWDIADGNGYLPLHLAAKTGNLSVVRTLLGAGRSKGISIDAATRDGTTALILALMNGKTEVAILLANNGANCAALIRDEPAWQWLVKQGLLKSAEFLLELLNKDLLSKHEAPNRISLYICHNKEWELIHDKVAAIEKYKSQHLNALDITVLDENWQPCTMGSLASVVSSQYCAVAYFYEFDLQSQEPLRTDIDPPEALSCIMDCFPDIGIPEGVVEEAAANGNWGLRLLHTLLDVRPEEVEVTEAAIKAMRRGGVARGGILHRLFDGRARLRITSGLLEQLAAVDEPFPLARVIHSYRDTAKVTEQVIKAAAENQYMVSIMLAKLLDYREEEVKITEEIITAAAENPSGATEALGFLLNRVPGEIKVTEKVLKAAAGNIKGKEVLTLLLDRRPHEVKITEEVVEAAAGNPSASAAREILTLLLEQRPDEMKFIEGVAEAAEAGLMSEEVLSLLLDFRTEPEDTGDSA